MRTRRLSAVLLACTAALVLSACGNKHSEILVGETEGAYIDIGEVKYQVQMSRLLNTASPEDGPLLAGVAVAERELENDEAWFGVWMRAENESDEAQPKVKHFEIKASDGETFEPLDLGPENPYAWGNQPAFVSPEGPLGLIPVPDSPAAESTIQGALLLFKMKYSDLENRPLELEIQSPTDPSLVGHVNLDI